MASSTPTPQPGRFSTASSSWHVVVVGGGITGLAAAYRLQQEARAQRLPLGITVLEQAGRLGGQIRTERQEGCIVELGPDIFLARKPRGIGLCREIGLEAQIRDTNRVQRGSYIQKKGTLYRLPEGLSGLIPTRLGPMLRTPLLSPWGKLRLVMDWLRPARRDAGDESVAAFITRRLGGEAYESLVEPLLGGIYGGNGHALSVEATLSQLRDLERRHGSLMRGLLKEQASRTGAASTQRAFVTLEGGMETMVARLGAQLGSVDIQLSRPVCAITREDSRYAVRTSGAPPMPADAVLVTTPAHNAAQLLASLDEGIADELGAIPYGSTVTLSMAFRTADVPRPLDAYGYIIPRSEGKAVLACTWSSTKIPGRAPDGMALIRVFLGRSDADAVFQQDDAAVVTAARAELLATLGITASPLFCRLHRWPQAMPQYVLGHPERLARIEQRLSGHRGLFLAGAAYRGVGIPDCIQGGEQAARQAVAFLTAMEKATVSEL